jgi:quercetin dioxygenase-like cupin family protein
LELVRYVIQPGTTLATHVHPGVQIAAIASGRLTYTVLRGEVPVTRAATAGTPGPTETIAAGEVTTLGPGDAVVEYPGAVHFGRNDGAEPVVILASTLLAAGQPPAIVVNAKGTPVA